MGDAEPYIAAIRVGALFADPAYQRDVDERRVTKMAAGFDRRLLGVLEVSDRGDDTYAVLDGQHRQRLVLAVAGIDSPVVCQVYSGLSVEDEARLFHEVNARRKALSPWDKWKARRAGGDERVAAIETTLANHVVLVSAFGHARQGFDGGMMQGLALVLTSYGRDELDMDRLVNQLRVPVRQMRARAQGLRELHSGTYPRLFAAVMIEQHTRADRAKRREPTATQNSPLGPSREVGEPGVRHEPRPAPGADLTGTSTDRPVGKVDEGVAHASSPTPTPSEPRLPTSSTMAVCECGHTQRRHDDHGEGLCLVGDGDCGCTAYTAAATS